MVIINNQNAATINTDWLKRSIPLIPWFAWLASNLAHSILDLAPTYDRLFSLFTPAVVLLEAYAFYYLCRRTPRLTALFILLITIVPCLALAIPTCFLAAYAH